MNDILKYYSVRNISLMYYAITGYAIKSCDIHNTMNCQGVCSKKNNNTVFN